MRGAVTLLCILTGVSLAFAQTKKIPSSQPSALSLPPQPEQDCIHAIPICNNSYFQQNSYSGQGLFPNEINPLYSCLTTGERNDVWYTFKVQNSGNLNFSITPINPLDDYDWAVFNITNKTCSQIFSDSALEVSCNFSANTGCGGVTGPNGLTSGFCGQQNEPVIPVIAGQTYVINVSNFSASQSGYSISFSSSTAIIYDTIPPKGVPLTVGCTQRSFTVTFNELFDCNSLSDPVTEFKLVEATGFSYGIQSINNAGCNNATSSDQLTIILYASIDKTTTAYLLAANGSDGNTISDVCGNFVGVNDTLAIIQVINDAAVNLGSDVNICPDTDKPLLNAQNTGAAVYAWSWNGIPLLSNTQTLQTVNPGTYSVNVIYGAGCLAADSMLLSFLPTPIINLGNDTAVCKDSKLPMLDAGNPGLQYSWFIDGVLLHNYQQTYQPVQPGLFSVSVMGTYCTSKDSVRIDLFPPLSLPLGSDQTLCTGDSLTIDATTAEVLNYQWFFNDNYFSSDPVITVMNAGKYTLSVIDSFKCETKDSLYVNSAVIPVAPLVHCPVNNGNYLEYHWNGVSDASGYEVSLDGGNTWDYPSSGINGLTHWTNPEISQILVRALSMGNCSPGPASPSEYCEVSIANIVTPNNDGRNDAFMIDNIGQYPNTSVLVLNRYGNEVFKSSDYKNDWIPDNLVSGTYFYMVALTDGRSFKGNLTILK